MGSAWEDAVDAAFVKTVGQYLADINASGSADEREEMFDRLCGEYESTIGELPEPREDEI